MISKGKIGPLTGVNAQTLTQMPGVLFNSLAKYLRLFYHFSFIHQLWQFEQFTVSASRQPFSILDRHYRIQQSFPYLCSTFHLPHQELTSLLPWF